MAIIEDDSDSRIPDVARDALSVLVEQHKALKVKIVELKAKIVAWHRSNEASRRLATIPGIGPITASALAATVPDPAHFRSARQFAAWLGLVPGSIPRAGEICSAPSLSAATRGYGV